MSPTATRTMRLDNGSGGRYRADEDQRSVLDAQLTETWDMVRFCRDRADQFKRDGLGNILDRRATYRERFHRIIGLDVEHFLSPGPMRQQRGGLDRPTMTVGPRALRGLLRC
jgi:hypothetical protein